MMSSIFCCSQVGPYKSRFLSHESKFQEFVQWAAFPIASSVEDHKNSALLLSELEYPYVVQVVRQVNYGTVESKRYFVATKGKNGAEPFIEVTEDQLIQENYEKLNSFKNYRCTTHNKFFELNVYQKDPVNKHHWRANIARPAGDIDL